MCSYADLPQVTHTAVVPQRNKGKINGEKQHGSMPCKNTTDAIIALRMLVEKYRDDLKELYCIFVDSEKAYDKREGLCMCSVCQEWQKSPGYV